MPKRSSFPIPATHLAWNLYGAGYEKLGRSQNPERLNTPEPAPDQILARIDSVGICYSDVKLINQGNRHPKLKGRNLTDNPVRPGHEVSFTVISLGKNLENQFNIGERFAIQPEIILQGKKLTYGFSLPGGLTQYQLIGPELLNTDKGPSIIKLDNKFGYAEASLLEPWGSVLASYNNNRRLIPKSGGKMWIIGNSKQTGKFSFSRYLDLPESVLVTNLQNELETAIRKFARNLFKLENIPLNQLEKITSEYTDGLGFDDIVILDPQFAEQVEIIFGMINQRGLLNLVGTRRLDREVFINPQRIHYEFVNVVGSSGQDISASYGLNNNRSDFQEGGTALMFGGGGPIGQMHLQRAITGQNGPQVILVIEINQTRIEVIDEKFSDLAQKHGKKLLIFNPLGENKDLLQIVQELTGKPAVDDVIVLVPDPDVLAGVTSVLHDHSLINLFAGTPAGIKMQIDLANCYLGNLQITGSSGLENEHIQAAYQLAQTGKINLNSTVAAVGGMLAASEAIQATEARRYPGRIIIYPQLEDLPLMDIPELAAAYPSIKSALGDHNIWTRKAEEKLLKIEGK